MDDIFHITVMGDGTVGKTFMLQEYLKLNSNNLCGYQPTVFEKYKVEIKVNSEKYTLQLWDTAGQEDYKKLRSLVYTVTDCFLICYAVDNLKSYENIIDKWVPELKRYKQKVPIIIVGTKIDLRSDINLNCFSEDTGLYLQKTIKAYKYVECSSLLKIGVDNVFIEAVNVILKKNKKNAQCSIA